MLRERSWNDQASVLLTAEFCTLQLNSPVLQRTVRFCEQLATVIPNSHVFYRRGLALKRIIPQCIARDFTDLIVINEDRKIPSILLCIFQGKETILSCTSEIYFCFPSLHSANYRAKNHCANLSVWWLIELGLIKESVGTFLLFVMHG